MGFRLRMRIPTKAGVFHPRQKYITKSTMFVFYFGRIFVTIIFFFHTNYEVSWPIFIIFIIHQTDSPTWIGTPALNLSLHFKMLLRL